MSHSSHHFSQSGHGRRQPIYTHLQPFSSMCGLLYRPPLPQSLSNSLISIERHSHSSLGDPIMKPIVRRCPIELLVLPFWHLGEYLMSVMLQAFKAATHSRQQDSTIHSNFPTSPHRRSLLLLPRHPEFTWALQCPKGRSVLRVTTDHMTAVRILRLGLGYQLMIFLLTCHVSSNTRGTGDPFGSHSRQGPSAAAGLVG